VDNFRVGGTHWHVGLERLGGAPVPRCDPAIARVAASARDRPHHLRLLNAAPSAGLPWPLPLRLEEEIHCHREPGLRIYFADGCIAFTPGEDAVDVYVGAAPGDVLAGAVGAGVLYRLARTGVLAFHAAALVTDAGAILAFGASGQGKSTLAAAWLHAGRVISDDHVVVSRVPGGGGGFWVEPLRADMYLRPGGTALLPESLRAWAEPVADSKRRIRRVRAPELFCGDAQVIGLVILDASARGPASRMQPVSQAEGLMAVIAGNSYLSAGQPFAPPALLAAARDLVCHVPAFRLIVGTDLLCDARVEARRLGELFATHLTGAMPGAAFG
jgi:hypothetical protein